MQENIIALGYHGTTRIAAEQILQTEFRESRRDDLWLGYGRYFFQDAPIHALRWGRYFAKKRTGSADDAAVLYAEIDLSGCIDLIDRMYWPTIGAIWENEVRHSSLAQVGMETLLQKLQMSDEDKANLSEEDRNALGQNYVDCRIMNIFIQRMRDKSVLRSGFEYTSVRAAFTEGQPVHPTSWLWTRSCVIISVLEPRAIKKLHPVNESELKQYMTGQQIEC